MTQLRNSLGLLLFVGLAVRVAAELVQPLVMPLAVLLVLVVTAELLLSRRRRW